MSTQVRLEDGSALTLGVVLARAGEGTVYEVVDHPEWVAKIFHPDLKDLHAKRAKVATMIPSQPPGAVQSDGFVVLTWPLHTVDSDDGATGYLMSRVDTTNAVEIHALSNPANRTNPLPSAPQWTPHTTWAHLVSVAANLCLAVESVHRVNAVIGDFQERNILVNDTTRVTLVDCDSFQFTDPDGHQYLCPVGRPEFTAPELAGTSLAQSARDKTSDLFALAVHIHLLLMAGNHPFLRGQWTGTGEQPDAMTLAQSGQWAGGPNSQLHTHPLAPPITFLPNNIQQLFVRAFTDGAHNPTARPTATQWRQALLAVRTTTCPHGHQIPVEADPCPWCTIDTERTALQQQRATAPIGRPTNTPPPVTPAPPRPTPTPPPDYAAPTPPTKTNRTPLIIAAAIVATIAIITGGIALSGNNSDNNASPNRASESGQYRSNTEDSSANWQTTQPRSSSKSLNVSIPMSHPPCDASGIVVLANAVTPGRYEADVQRALDLNPGASYLRTDESCNSLRPRDDAGNAIYAVYRPAGRTQAEICAAVRAAGGGAYGKWLDSTTSPRHMISC